jgi:hypothetical protein
MVGKDGGTDDRFARAHGGRLRRLHPRPQYVRAGRRRLGRARLEGLVGRQSAVPRADLRPHQPRPGANCDGGRDDLPFRHRRDRGGARPSQGGRGRPRRKDRRRSFDDSPVPARRSDRRVAGKSRHAVQAEPLPACDPKQKSRVIGSC